MRSYEQEQALAGPEGKPLGLCLHTMNPIIVINEMGFFYV